MNKVIFKETAWTVSRQAPPAGWRAKGEQVQPRESGLWFRSSTETRFLPMDSAALPSQAQLDAMTVEQLEPLFRRATVRGAPDGRE